MQSSPVHREVVGTIEGRTQRPRPGCHGSAEGPSKNQAASSPTAEDSRSAGKEDGHLTGHVVQTCHLVPGGPRQGSLWSSNMSPIQGGRERCVCMHACMRVRVCEARRYGSHPCITRPSTDSPVDSELGHIRACVHSSVGPDRGLGEGRVLSTPVSTP